MFDKELRIEGLGSNPAERAQLRPGDRFVVSGFRPFRCLTDCLLVSTAPQG
jgi:hypothetical protein